MVGKRKLFQHRKLIPRKFKSNIKDTDKVCTSCHENIQGTSKKRKHCSDKCKMRHYRTKKSKKLFDVMQETPKKELMEEQSRTFEEQQMSINKILTF